MSAHHGDAVIESGELLDRANAALAELNPMGARIFVVVLDDLVFETIAAIEDVSVETAQRVYEDACKGNEARRAI